MGSRIPGTGFQSLSEERGFWIPIISRTLDSLSGIPESKALPYMERLADHLMKENYSQEEHQQQYYIGYFESNTIGCNSRDSSGSRHCRRRYTYVIADFHLTVVKLLNGTVIVNNFRGAVVVHGTQLLQL